MSSSEIKKVIPEEAYRALQSIVGSRYVTVNLAECQAYTGRGCYFELFWWQGISHRAAAAILPRNAEQVSHIIKVCNHYSIPYLAVSTFGWSPFCSPTLRDDFLVIDLKRIDSLEIDEKNMYALIGPGVIYAQLQGEAMKRGLYTMLPAGGGGVGVVANHLTYGVGSLCYRITSSPVRRMNGVEWVSPEGEIVRMGSLVNGDDSGYWRGGLGAGLLGLLKGSSAWTGSMGVVTKMALKLYPFQPEKLEPEGIGGDSAVKLPPRMTWHNITFLSEKALQAAMREIANAQIAAYINRVSAYWRDIAKCRGNEEFRRIFWDSWGKLTPEAVANVHILRVLLVGYTSQPQREYEERVLTDIVAECGGTLRRTKQTDEACFFYANSPDVWVMTGAWLLLMVGMESLRCALKAGQGFTKRWEEGYQADAMDEYGELPWYMPLELGRSSYSETDVYPDSVTIDPEYPQFDRGRLKRLFEFFESVMPAIEVTAGWLNVFSSHTGASCTSDATRHHTPVWAERFQKEFNPEGLSNPGFPYFGDKVNVLIPGIINEEILATVDGVKRAKWRGT